MNVMASIKIRLLAPELPVALKPRGIKLTARQCLQYGTPRLVFVLTVAKTAMCRQQFNVCESFSKATVAVPELQLAQARRVNDQTAHGKTDQLAPRCGMTASLIGLTDGLDSLTLLTCETVDER